MKTQKKRKNKNKRFGRIQQFIFVIVKACLKFNEDG